MYPRRRLRAPCLMMHGSPYYLEPSMGIWDHHFGAIILGPSFWSHIWDQPGGRGKGTRAGAGVGWRTGLAAGAGLALTAFWLPSPSRRFFDRGLAASGPVVRHV